MQGIFGEGERANMAEEFSISCNHVPHVQTGESDSLQVSRRLDAASCEPFLRVVERKIEPTYVKLGAAYYGMCSVHHPNYNYIIIILVGECSAFLASGSDPTHLAYALYMHMRMDGEQK